jgi:hypothetical protein
MGWVAAKGDSSGFLGSDMVNEDEKLPTRAVVGDVAPVFKPFSGIWLRTKHKQPAGADLLLF